MLPCYTREKGNWKLTKYFYVQLPNIITFFYASPFYPLIYLTGLDFFLILLI